MAAFHLSQYKVKLERENYSSIKETFEDGKDYLVKDTFIQSNYLPTFRSQFVIDFDKFKSV